MSTTPPSPPESTGLDREIEGEATLRIDPATAAPTTVAGERDIPSVNRQRATPGAVGAGQKAFGSVIAAVAMIAIVWYFWPTFTGKKRGAAEGANAVALAPKAEEQKEPPKGNPTELKAELDAEAARKAARAAKPPPVVGPIPLADANGPVPEGAPALAAPGSAGPGDAAEQKRRKEAQDLVQKRQHAPLLAFGEETGRGASRGAAVRTEGPAGDVGGPMPAARHQPMTREEATAIAQRIANGEKAPLGQLWPTSASAASAGGFPSASSPKPAAASYVGPSPGGGAGGELDAKLQQTPVMMVEAAVLPDRDLLLTQGTFIDCTLETAMDSTVPGFTRCVTTRNVYSNSGRVVLLERGTKIIGQYQGGVKQGQSRIFVLWTRAETPHGVVIELGSPGTDPLGAAGLPGELDTKFWTRFGGALLLSVIQDAFDIAKAKAGAEVVGDTTNTQQAGKDAAGIALENSINVPPSLYKNQGEKVNIVIAKDLDFSGVYSLRLSN